MMQKSKQNNESTVILQQATLTTESSPQTSTFQKASTTNINSKKKNLSMLQPTNGNQAVMSTPSDQSARSSLTQSARSSLTGSNSTTHSKKQTTTKVVVVNLAQNSTSGKGKKSKRSKAAAGNNNIKNTFIAGATDLTNDGVITTQTSSSNASVEMTPQRSRSEAPTGNSIGNVLYEVHKKMMNRGRKLSPAKLQAKQQQRQQKAEDLRAKIELSRKEYAKKVSQRQQLTRARFQETIEIKRLNLHERLEQAARNKEAELQNVVEKAKAENERAAETNFIIKLTNKNNKLDLNNKLNEGEERRKLIEKKDMTRIKEQGLKRETVAKRRVELNEEMRFKVLSKEQKREQAEQRRKERQIEEKNKAMAEKMKRDLVRARVRRHKISDIMSFVSNRESLWEFIGMEQDLESMGLQFNLGDAETLNALDETVDGGVHNLSESELLSMIQQDQFELEKLMLKRDHEILCTCIVEEPDGSIKILKNPMSLLQRGRPKSSSSSCSIDSTDEKKGLPQVPVNQIRGATNSAFMLQPTACAGVIEDPKYFSPAKQSSAQTTGPQQPQNNNESNIGKGVNDIRRLKFQDKQNSQSFRSNQSSSIQDDSVKSRDEIMTQDGDDFETRKTQSTVVVSEFGSKSAQTVLEDEKIDQKLRQQRVRVAMRRNILKRNLSEDLVWAAELQSNPNFEMVRFIGQGVMHYQQANAGTKQLETRSQASSLERDQLDGLEDEIGSTLRESTLETPPKGGQGTKLGKTSAAHLSKRNKKQGNKHNQSSRSSLHSSGPINLHGVSGGSKDLVNLMNSNRGKRNSIQELQQTFKQKKTLSNNGSCSSLSSLIQKKNKQEENEEYSDTKGSQQTGTLNQAQLEQLGPVVKMTINGFPFSTQSPSQQQQTTSHFHSNNNLNHASASSSTAFNQNSQQSSILTHNVLSAHENQMQMVQSQLSSTTNGVEELNSDGISIMNSSANQIEKNSHIMSSSSLSIHISSLIMSQRPVPSKTNLSSVQYTSSNFSKNANQYLFPIREQKIILMYKERGPEFHFVQAKINLKLDEVRIDKEQAQSLASSQSQTQLSSTPQQSVSSKKANLLDSSTTTTAASTTTTTTTTHNDITASPITPQKSHRQSVKDSHYLTLEETKRTPTKASNRTSTPNSGKKAGDRNSTNKTTPGRDSHTGGNHGDNSQDTLLDDSIDNDIGQSDRMVNLIVKKLLVDKMQYIRIDDSQKSILIDKDKDSQAVLKYLEVNELKFGYCRICEIAIYSEYSASSDAEEAKANVTITEHYQSKAHVRKRDGLQIRESEDTAYSLLVFCSQPGDIDVELRKENEKALKRKVKRLKTSMQTLAVSHENASTYPGKELKSSNKNRLQIRCIELQKSVFPEIKFDTVEAILNDVLKVLELRGRGDLHLMRKLKFVPTMVDMICKRITTCPRSKLGALAKVINSVIKILSKFCTMRENRNYMIQTNRVMPLIELLSWCLNRQTELFFGIEFMPGLFQTITTHLKHRVPYECQLLKEHMVDLLICSQIPAKLKNKLAIVKSIQSNENEDSLGQVPFFLLKSVAFLEALTAMISIDARTRPVYEKSYKIGEHVFFVLQTTELLGITQMITTLLLTFNETFKASAPSSASSMVLPQTILSLAIFSIKVLNNMMRMDVGIVQHMMLDFNEQLYHLLSFILSYTEVNIDESDDVKELLHETLIFIGYLCLLNEANQKMLQRGENSILQKLCNLPFTYFMDKKLKEILFPTLVTASFRNDRSVAIMDQEMNMTEFLVKYIETNIAEELPKIIEQEQEYFSDHTKSMSSFGRTRSPSQHSTGSTSNQSVQMDFLSGNNPYLPLVMRFPKNLWKDASQYFKSKAD